MLTNWKSQKDPSLTQQQQGRPALRLPITMCFQELCEERTATARRRQGFDRVGPPKADVGPNSMLISK
jgi:hypothetical protein